VASRGRTPQETARRLSPPPSCADYRGVADRAGTGALEGGRRLSSRRDAWPGAGTTVSVITVAYNASATLERTIRSVLEQEYRPLEYLVVDGGSTDGTIELLRAHDDRIDYFRSEPDQGISDAFNKGIALARGEVIALLNADDWYLPGAVSAAVVALAEDPNCGFVFGDLLLEEESGESRMVQKGDSDYLRQISWTMPSVPHPTVFVRRQVYERYGLFRTELTTAMDYEWLLRVSLQGVRGKYLPQLQAGMRLGGLSDTAFSRGYREVFQVSIAYGHPWFRAAVRLAAKTLKGGGRRLLERCGVRGLVKVFRKLAGSRYHYR